MILNELHILLIVSADERGIRAIILDQQKSAYRSLCEHYLIDILQEALIEDAGIVEEQQLVLCLGMDAACRNVNRRLIAVDDWNDKPILEDLLPVPDDTEVCQPLIQIVITTGQFHDVSG